MLERVVERRLVKEIKNLGGLCYKFVSPGNVGVPDRILVLESGVIIFAEIKADKGKLTMAQRSQISKIRGRHQRAVVVYGIPGVEKLVDLIKRSRYDLIPDELR